jgi:hypothetical protein
LIVEKKKGMTVGNGCERTVMIEGYQTKERRMLSDL